MPQQNEVVLRDEVLNNVLFKAKRRLYNYHKKLLYNIFEKQDHFVV
jgi:hypothetical protein